MITFEPVKILFNIGSFNVYSWGLFHVIAFIVAFILIYREFKKKDIEEKHVFNIGLIALVADILGSRVFYILEHLSYFIAKPLEIFAFWQGGMTSYGGLILAILFCWIYIRKQRDLNFPEILDIVAPYLALALAIGRIGCFLNWDDYGIYTQLPWGISIASESPRHPTQLYLLITNLIIFGILMKLKSKREWHGKLAPLKKHKYGALDVIHEKAMIEKPGFIFLSFLLLYSIFRFLIDFLRVYEIHFLGLALSQWILAIVFIFSIVMIVRLRSK